MTGITLVFAYYDNGNMLRRQIQEWRRYSTSVRQMLKIIIVDDGSPNKPAAEILQKNHPDIEHRVYRIVPNIPWNQDGARNLAMRECTTEWAFMTDMDHLLPAHQARQLIDFRELYAKRTCYYMPNQYTVAGLNLHYPHPNSYLFRRTDFWRMGGYDEDFAGVYGSDGNFRKCCKGSGLSEIYTEAFHHVAYRGEDIADARTNEFGRKESQFYRPNHPRVEAKARGPAYKAINPIRFEFTREI